MFKALNRIGEIKLCKTIYKESVRIYRENSDMKKRRLALTIYFVLTLTYGICQDFEFKPDYSIALEVENGKSLLKQCSRGTPKNIISFWKVAENDIILLENNFKKIKKVKPSNCCFSERVISRLNKYGLQYIGVTIREKKYIYINAFYIDSKDQLQKSDKNWLSEPVIVCDGGDHYWGVLFDLEKIIFKDLMINGLG